MPFAMTSEGLASHHASMLGEVEMRSNRVHKFSVGVKNCARVWEVKAALQEMAAQDNLQVAGKPLRIHVEMPPEELAKLFRKNLLNMELI